jgi:hypothetical protein
LSSGAPAGEWTKNETRGIGLALFAVGSAAPLFSPDLALVPPGPVNLPRFTVLYYLPRIILSGVISAAAISIIFTEIYSKQDKYWAYGMFGAVLALWVFWLRS